MIVIFTGDGKGKTTAALGAAVRAVGQGQRVLMLQFIKGPWKSGEDFVKIRQAKRGKTPPSSGRAGEYGKFKLVKKGLGFVGILGDKLPFADHQKAAQSALSYIKEEIQAKKWDFFILDEVNVAVSLKLITAQEVIDVVNDVDKDKVVILTGRGAPQEFIDCADLVTEMKEVKHPFVSGSEAMKGAEF